MFHYDCLSETTRSVWGCTPQCRPQEMGCHISMPTKMKAACNAVFHHLEHSESETTPSDLDHPRLPSNLPGADSGGRAASQLGLHSPAPRSAPRMSRPWLCSPSSECPELILEAFACWGKPISGGHSPQTGNQRAVSAMARRTGRGSKRVLE